MAEESPATPGGASTKLVVIIIVGAILLVLSSMGGIFFLLKSMGMLNPGSGGAGSALVESINKDKPAIYHAFEPSFVVNFKERGRTRYLQIDVQVMTRDPEVIPDLETHMPLIRNNLLLLFSGQEAEKLHSAEGKEQLRTAALKEVQRILEEQTGKKEVVEALYFTSFVTQ